MDMSFKELLMQFIKPELFVVSIVLFFIGMALKKTKKIADWLIPFILGIIGIALAAIYVFATSDICSYKEMLMAIFTIIIQGILVAGASVYVDQLIKQAKEKEEK